MDEPSSTRALRAPPLGYLTPLVPAERLQRATASPACPFEQNADATPTPTPLRDRGPGRLRRPGPPLRQAGADAVVDHIAEGAVISAVNLSEVATILIRRGRDPPPF